MVHLTGSEHFNISEGLGLLESTVAYKTLQLEASTLFGYHHVIWCYWGRPFKTLGEGRNNYEILWTPIRGSQLLIVFTSHIFGPQTEGNCISFCWRIRAKVRVDEQVQPLRRVYIWSCIWSRKSLIAAGQSLRGNTFNAISPFLWGDRDHIIVLRGTRLVQMTPWWKNILKLCLSS